VAHTALADEAHRLNDAKPAISPWLRRSGPAVLLVSLVLYGIEYLHWPGYSQQIDVLVYRFGATRILHGLDLYSTGMWGRPDQLLFTYTPFAALCFIPLALFGRLEVEVFSLLAMSGLLIYAVVRMLRWLGVTAAPGLWPLAALLLGVLVWLEPVRQSIQLGQINLVILAVVIADVLSPPQRRWAGVGIGVVAGIKMTPAIFILYLLLIGRRRAALVATGALAGTVALGFAVLPRASVYYWGHGHFGDPHRINRDPTVSSSVYGLFLRLHYPASLGAVAALMLAVAGLALGVIAHRRARALWGVSVVGLTSAAVSPFSWTHHWVWFAPLVVHLGYRAYVTQSRWAPWAMWSSGVLLAGWPTQWHGRSIRIGMAGMRPGGIWNQIMPSVYVFIFLLVIVATATWWLAGRASKSTDEYVAASGLIHRSGRGRPGSAIVGTRD
jgi:alpha-1,2-mannosyltransferase